MNGRSDPAGARVLRPQDDPIRARPASIDCFTSSLSSRGFLPMDSIGSPLTPRIGPGFFKKPRLGQNVPALWDSGTTLLPDAIASKAPLTPNLGVFPATTRVP